MKHALVAAALAGLLVLAMFVLKKGPFRDLAAEYRHMIDKSVLSYPQLVAHFPRDPAPDGAKLADVYYFAGWGTRWGARFESEAHVESMRRIYPPPEQEPPPGLYEESDYRLPREVVPKGKTLKDYHSVLLQTRSGNHGHRAGLSISKTGRDVVYWAERW